MGVGWDDNSKGAVIGNSRFLVWVMIMGEGCSRVLPCENGMVPLDSGSSYFFKDQGICVSLFLIWPFFTELHTFKVKGEGIWNRGTCVTNSHSGSYRCFYLV